MFPLVHVYICSIVKKWVCELICVVLSLACLRAIFMNCVWACSIVHYDYEKAYKSSDISGRQQAVDSKLVAKVHQVVQATTFLLAYGWFSRTQSRMHNLYIRESVDSLCRDGTDTPIT